MNIEELKEKANGYIGTARGMLVTDKVYFPMLYGIKENDDTMPVGLHNRNEEDQKEITEIMEIMSDNSTALILVLDMHLIEYDEKTEAKPTKVKEDPRSTPALLSYIFTKDASLMKQVRYSVKKDNYSFFNFDWESLTEISDNLKNPFQKD